MNSKLMGDDGVRLRALGMRLVREGRLSNAEIAAQLGVSRGTIRAWRDRPPMTPGQRAAVSRRAGKAAGKVWRKTPPRDTLDQHGK